MIDVLTEVAIDVPREVVASYAADPANATAWYKHVIAVEVDEAVRYDVLGALEGAQRPAPVFGEHVDAPRATGRILGDDVLGEARAPVVERLVVGHRAVAADQVRDLVAIDQLLNGGFDAL